MASVIATLVIFRQPAIIISLRHLGIKHDRLIIIGDRAIEITLGIFVGARAIEALGILDRICQFRRPLLHYYLTPKETAQEPVLGKRLGEKACIVISVFHAENKSAIVQIITTRLAKCTQKAPVILLVVRIIFRHTSTARRATSLKSVILSGGERDDYL